MDHKNLRRMGKNVLVDGLSIVIVFGILYISAQGFTTLYSAWWSTGKPPSPDVFQLASTQFTGAIGLVYTLLQTRKHYSPKTETSKEQNQETRKQGNL